MARIWAATYLNGGNAQRSLEEAERAVELDPHHVAPLFILGEALVALGRMDEALVHVEAAYHRAPWTIAAGLLASMLAKRGDTARAASILEQMGPSPSPVWGRVLYHLHMSEIDSAADWYERMIDERDPFALIYNAGQITAPLRAHPRWRHLAERMKLPTNSS